MLAPPCSEKVPTRKEDVSAPMKETDGFKPQSNYGKKRANRLRDNLPTGVGEEQQAIKGETMEVFQPSNGNPVIE